MENLKDRATVIFDIYLKLGRGQYLLIESFQGKPLVLKPFEVYYKEFEPLFFYTEGTKIVKTRNFLFDKKLSTKILLSTTDGKYVVNSNLKRWNPITDFFKNYFTAIIQPVRVPYKGKSYGDKTKYLVELKYSSGSNQVIDIYEGDDRLMKFKNFSLTRESLKSSKSLKAYFKKQRKQGNISFEKIKVIDFGEKFNEIKNRYGEEVIKLEEYSFFKYNVVGPIYTRYQNYKLDRENKRMRKKNKAVNS